MTGLHTICDLAGCCNLCKPDSDHIDNLMAILMRMIVMLTSSVRTMVVIMPQMGMTEGQKNKQTKGTLPRRHPVIKFTKLFVY